MISKGTTLCISIAKYPSNFGTTLFNAAFKALRLNFLYKAFRIEAKDLKKVIDGIGALGIRGCGVSMPFKKEAIKYLDSLDEVAREIGAVNTIINNNGHLKGYNTDYYGAIEILRKVRGVSEKKVLMLGAGGVASAIASALKHKKVRGVTISNRSRQNGILFAKRWGFQFIPWQERNNSKTDLLINATPVGMAPDSSQSPIKEESIANFKIIMDVVINPLESKLIKLARHKKKEVIPGYKMSLFQAAKQFELYTKRKAPIKIMEQSLKKLLSRSYA